MGSSFVWSFVPMACGLALLMMLLPSPLSTKLLLASYQMIWRFAGHVLFWSSSWNALSKPTRLHTFFTCIQIRITMWTSALLETTFALKYYR